MQFGISLLPKKKVDLGKKRFLRRIKTVIGGVLLIYIILIAGLFALSFFLSSSEKKLEQEARSLETEIQKFKKKESLEVALKERVSHTEKIFKAREKVRQAEINQKQLFAWVQSLVLPGISLGKIDVSLEEVAFSGKAQNVLALGGFIDQFQEQKQELEKKFSWIGFDSLTRTPGGIYSFSLKANPLPLR